MLAQVAPYLVATAWCLLQVNSASAEHTSVRAKWEKLRMELLGLEDMKHKFEECYDLLAGEKASMED